MEGEWNIINENNYLVDEHEEEVPLLNLERGNDLKTSEDIEMGKSPFEDLENDEGKGETPLAQPLFRKRPKKRQRSGITLHRSDRINYVITGSGFLEPSGSKRLKTSDQDFIRINVSPHQERDHRRPSSTFTTNAVFIIILCAFVVFITLMLVAYIMVSEYREYYSYEDLTKKNETLPFNQWVHCR